jgi:Plasmid pRiA4b ORF-3-like protein
MPGSPPPAGPFVYQLRVVLRGVSPLIWRRLLVHSDSSIADLHATLQIALGWSDEHLNRFVIHSREYGVAHPGGLWFRDDPHKVSLADLGLRVGERFLYEYDFFDGWCHDVRVEALLPIKPARRYPMCTGGARSAPPEGCGGPWAFMEQRQRYSPLRLLELLAELLEADPDRRVREVLGDRYEELEELCRWLQVDHFDRRGANRRLTEEMVAGARSPG